MFRLILLPFKQDGLATTEVDVGRRQVVQALEVTVIVIVADEIGDLEFEVARQQEVLEQDAVLQGLVPTLDLALGLGMIGISPNMLPAVVSFLGNLASKLLTENPSFGAR